MPCFRFAVAVAGLPEYRRDHAVAMARVARDCVVRTHELTRKLELKLGPGTSELSVRIGLHSGAVTGVCALGLSSIFAAILLHV